MTTPQTPLPKRRPLRTREELLQAGRQRAGDMQSAPEPAERLAALLMLAFPVKPSGAGPPDTSTGEDGPDRWLTGPGQAPPGATLKNVNLYGVPYTPCRGTAVPTRHLPAIPIPDGRGWTATRRFP